MKTFIERMRNNIIYIIVIVILIYIFFGSLLCALWYLLLRTIDWSPAMTFINYNYTSTLGSVAALFLTCMLFKKNRFILRSFLPKGKGKDHKVLVVEDTYEPSNNNTLKTLLAGLLIGFVTNFACIAVAMAHGDVKLYFDFAASQIPVLIFGFLMVFIQSSSEEMWCRGFMYERISIHYPLWVAVLMNGVFFGLLHVFNDGATPLAIFDAALYGISYSLIRWYSGSIWMVMGMHTMWNFNQNLLFGLPNSGLVSELSVLHMDAANGTNNLFYDYVFGVEGAITAVIIDLLLIIIVLLLAKRDGRLSELTMSYEKKAALSAGQAGPDINTSEPGIISNEQPE